MHTVPSIGVSNSIVDLAEWIILSAKKIAMIGPENDLEPGNAFPISLFQV